MKDHIEHINYALVEDTRPPMYTAMKYWGKKPHNIWSQFIEHYSKEGGTVFDPFSGSAVSAFEAVKLKRKAIAFDLNPLTGFMIESLTSSFNEDEFLNEFKKINSFIEQDKIYQKHFTLVNSEGSKGTIYNFKWIDSVVSAVAYKIGDVPHTAPASKSDIKNGAEQSKIQITDWFPTDKFPKNPSITYKFIKDIGGDSFENLWTRRNLYVLSKIFDKISKIKKENIKLQLLSGFIQTVHLCSKMVVPRDPKSKRDFSGSWGRADYMIRRRSMEQNPLIVFQRSCVEKQSILHALRDFKETFPKGITINDVSITKKIKKGVDINYGSVDVGDISKFVKTKSVDFIITDPPYAGLVFYLDLSLIWLVWLKKINSKYNPDLRSEITIKKGVIERAEYRRKMENAFKEIHKVLKDDAFLVITFHHPKIQEWNDFVKAVRFAGFKFDKVTHQYNKRSGESNVANPYGTSGSDFYIRCVKFRTVDFTDDISGLEHFIVQKTIEIIAMRNQPTPYTILVGGLIPEMLQAGFFQPDEYRGEINRILQSNSGEDKIFKSLENTENKAGEFWWFQDPSKYINYPNLSLDRRVEDTIISLLRRKNAVKFDDVLAELFKKFPNGLTPDPRRVNTVVEKYAYKSAEKWKIKEDTINSITKHTEVISGIITLGKKLKFKIFVGRREQPEKVNDKQNLRELADYHDLNFLKPEFDPRRIERIEMIDCVWFDAKNNIAAIFEVENSTDFTSAIQRGSNLGFDVQKFMIVPDKREKELKKISDPYFTEGFKSNNWKYLRYQDIGLMSGYSKITFKEMWKASKV